MTPVNHYKFRYTEEIKQTKINTVIEAVSQIQQSVGWDAMDLRIATRRLPDPNSPKILVKDNQKNLVGYAVAVPQGSSWYLSQIAVHSTHQRRGVGRNIMEMLFKKAIEQKVQLVTIETDESNQQFYESKFENTTVSRRENGFYRSGAKKILYTYSLGITR